MRASPPGGGEDNAEGGKLPVSLRCMLPHRIVRVLRPILIGPPRDDLLHGDAVRHRADMHAEITAHAFLFDHLVTALPACPQGGDRLVRSVFAGDVTEAA